MFHGEKLQGQLGEAVVEQLATVPEPWLERLQDESMAYVALGYGEDLSHTDLITSYTPERLMREAKIARELSSEVQSEVGREIEAAKAEETDEFRLHMLERGKPDMISEKLAARLNEAGLGFAIRVTRDLTPLQYVEQESGVEASDYDEFLDPSETERGIFREVLLELNGPSVVKDAGGDAKGLPLADDATLEPPNDLLLIPYKLYGDKRLSEVSKESYSSIDGLSMDQHLGAHYWSNRLIVMDDDVAELPSTKTGFHSVVLHETGHAMDYIAEAIPELNHRETVDRLYEKDMERARAGENPFLTTRADDNVREYFAEAVEAYLTQPVDGGGNVYKQENNCVELQKQNPELYAYVDRLMKS